MDNVASECIRRGDAWAHVVSCALKMVGDDIIGADGETGEQSGMPVCCRQ